MTSVRYSDFTRHRLYMVRPSGRMKHLLCFIQYMLFQCALHMYTLMFPYMVLDDFRHKYVYLFP